MFKSFFILILFSLSFLNATDENPVQEFYLQVENHADVVVVLQLNEVATINHSWTHTSIGGTTLQPGEEGIVTLTFKAGEISDRIVEVIPKGQGENFDNLANWLWIDLAATNSKKIVFTKIWYERRWTDSAWVIEWDEK